MEKYYLITFSWKALSTTNNSGEREYEEKFKVKKYKLFTDIKKALREVASVNVISRDIDSWISDQMVEVCRSECSTIFKCVDGLYRIVSTSDYPEKSKYWRQRHNSHHSKNSPDHNLIEVISNTIIEAERDNKLNELGI